MIARLGCSARGNDERASEDLHGGLYRLYLWTMISDMQSAKSRDVVLQTNQCGLSPASGIEINRRRLPLLAGMVDSVSGASRQARKDILHSWRLKCRSYGGDSGLCRRMIK